MFDVVCTQRTLDLTPGAQTSFNGTGYTCFRLSFGVGEMQGNYYKQWSTAVEDCGRKLAHQVWLCSCVYESVL